MARTKRIECPSCKIAKAPKDFYAWSKQGGGDGISYPCRECESARHKAAAAKKSKTSKRGAK